MNWLRRIGFLSVLSMLVAVLGTAVAYAASAPEVADELSRSGYYLESGVTITESEAVDIINHVDDGGAALYLAVLNDTPLGGSQAFAETVRDELDVPFGTVLVLSPNDAGAASIDEFSTAELNAALDHADEVGGSDGEYAAAFAVGLVGSSGGGGGGLIWLLIIVGGIGLVLWLLFRRGKKQTVNEAAQRMAEARAVVQKQVDAIANDILDMEDEVRVANNDEVDELYNQASTTYRSISERLQQADTPQELVELSNDLDVAIWQLDCAEAVLDGKPRPPKPERKRLEPERPAEDRVTIPAPRPDYQRRPGRRSSYGGSGVMEILIGVAGQVLAGGGRRGGGLGGMFGGRSTPRQSSPPRASGSGGGGVIPGPGSPVPRTRRSSGRSRIRRSTSRARRRGGGKASAGRRRRRG